MNILGEANSDRYCICISIYITELNEWDLTDNLCEVRKLNSKWREMWYELHMGILVCDPRSVNDRKTQDKFETLPTESVLFYVQNM